LYQITARRWQVSAAKAEVLAHVHTAAAHTAAAAGALVPMPTAAEAAAEVEDDPASMKVGARAMTARVGGGEWTKLHALAESLALNGSPPQLASILSTTVAQQLTTLQVSCALHPHANSDPSRPLLSEPSHHVRATCISPQSMSP
jgi:hypothetical protein